MGNNNEPVEHEVTFVTLGNASPCLLLVSVDEAKLLLKMVDTMRVFEGDDPTAGIRRKIEFALGNMAAPGILASEHVFIKSYSTHYHRAPSWGQSCNPTPTMVSPPYLSQQTISPSMTISPTTTPGGLANYFNTQIAPVFGIGSRTPLGYVRKK